MTRIPLILVGSLIAAALVYQVLDRVPPDALNVALGVACGIGASIPVSLGLLIALTRQRRGESRQGDWDDRYVEPTPPLPYRPKEAAQAQQAQQPQIIVIAPPQGQFAAGQAAQGFPLPANWLNQFSPAIHENPEAVDAREWRIIGEE